MKNLEIDDDYIQPTGNPPKQDTSIYIYIYTYLCIIDYSNSQGFPNFFRRHSELRNMGIHSFYHIHHIFVSTCIEFHKKGKICNLTYIARTLL